MARVRLNETHDLPEEHRWLFERLEAQGPILNIFRAMSHSPVALRRFMKFGSYFLGEGKLDPKLRELAILRAGYLCRAPYEFSQHVSFGRRVGLSDNQIRGIAQPDAALFSPEQMAVLAYAGELTADSRVSDAAFAAVAAFLTDEEIVELTMVTSFYNMVSRTLNALQVDIDAPALRDLAEVGVEL
jgi:4-carboxymuconolactone decarboxylase